MHDPPAITICFGFHHPAKLKEPNQFQNETLYKTSSKQEVKGKKGHGSLALKHHPPLHFPISQTILLVKYEI